MKVQALLTEWLENDQKDRVKAQTYSRYKAAVTTHIIPAIGDREITELGSKDIREFLSEKKKSGNVRTNGKLSASSVNMIRTVLNLAFEYARDMEYIKENPCLRVRRTKEEGKKIEAFTVEEQRVLEREIERSDDARLHGILLCLYTGLRIGELLGLTWDDVDLERGILRVSKTVYRDKKEDGVWQLCTDTPKTRSSVRTIPLPEYMVNMLRRDREASETQYIVVNKKGERMPIRSYQYTFEKLTERAGVRKLNFHSLRHTFATRAIECGIDIRTVADIMGHHNASITLNRYAQCLLDRKIEMMHKIPRIM